MLIATTAPTALSTARADRAYGRAGGLFYLLTFASSIPALLMLSPILNDPGYILSAGSDNQILWACLLDVTNALACVGSAVAVYPVTKRVSQALALGFVTTRLIEAGVILVGVIALLSVVVLRQQGADGGLDPASLTVTGHALVIVRDWTFLFGPGFMASFNALMFGTLLFRSGLVPRGIPLMGLIGAPLLLAANLLTFFGLNTQTGLWTMLVTLPVAAWELSVGIYLTVKGFRTVAATA